MPPIPKPEPRKRTKARKARTEAAVKKIVREACVVRDGHCLFLRRIEELRFVGWPPGCSGPSEWAHLPPWTRARTAKMPSEQRHSTRVSAMLCRTHHDHLDGRRRPRLILTPTTPDGADGPITAEVK